MNNIQLLPSYEVNIESCLPEKIQLRNRTEKTNVQHTSSCQWL